MKHITRQFIYQCSGERRRKNEGQRQTDSGEGEKKAEKGTEWKRRGGINREGKEKLTNQQKW
jgi:hypothetical protein